MIIPSQKQNMIMGIIGIIVVVTVTHLLSPVPVASPVDQHDLTFFTPFANNTDMWDQIMQAYPDYATMTDLQKTTALRTWASLHLYSSGWVNLFDHVSLNYEPPYVVFNHFSTFTNGNAGVMCAGYAHALCSLYQYAGFPAWYYDYADGQCAHAVTLVLINQPETGGKTVIYQDAYFDLYPAWPNGTAMSLFDLINETQHRRYENIVAVEAPVLDYGVWAPRADYDIFNFQPVMMFDEDSTLYHFWFNIDTFHKLPWYIESRDAFLNETNANDWDLVQYAHTLSDYSSYDMNMSELQAMEDVRRPVNIPVVEWDDE
jgi:hypothetical protein